MKTWTDIASFVADIQERETSNPSLRLYLELGNQALHEISKATKPLAGYWTSAVGGELTLSSQDMLLPPDCLEVKLVAWNSHDQEIQIRSQEWFAQNLSGYRVDTSAEPSYCYVTGSTVVFDTNPTGLGDILLWGFKSLPEFSLDVTDPNPLEYLPITCQLLPAYYILKELPFNPEVKMEVMRVTKYTDLWNNGFNEVISAVRDRSMVPFDPGSSELGW